MKVLTTKESGLATLTITLLLLTAATGVTIYTAKSKLNESKVAANDHQSRVAFLNAESGLDYALSLMNSDGWQSASGVTKTPIGAANSGKNKYTVEEHSSFFTIEITEQCADCGIAIVSAKGYADGTNVDKTISKIISFNVGVKSIDAPLLAAGSSYMTGSINVNPDGLYPGGESASRSIVAGGMQVNTTGSQNTGGIEPETNVAALRGDNFFDYMGVPEKKWDEYRDDDAVTVINGCSTLTDVITQGKQTIWVEGDCEIPSGSIGSSDSPITLIVNDGNISGGGGTESKIYGLLYAFDSSNVPSGTSQKRLGVDYTGKVIGAAIFDYKYTFRYNSSLHILYEESMIKDRYVGGLQASAFWIPGGWHDI